MRTILIQFILILLVSLNAYGQQGAIRGVIFDGKTGEYLPGVTVFIEGTTTGTISDLDGRFNINIARGKYSMRISFISYETLLINDVEVTESEVTNLGEIVLEEASISLNEVTITANAVRNTETALISIKKNSVNLLDGISQGYISRIGESNVAGAMKRISGVSVSQGKYIYVRGLGDRYTKSLLNGVDIPGLDPDRNTIQMDIFPSGIINNIIVYKTFSAELPADFTGGAIDIEIKDFPDKKEGSVSASIGYNPVAHFNNEFLTYKGGKTDFLGFDDGTRAIPAVEDIPQFALAVGNPEGKNGTRYRNILSEFSPTMAAIKKLSMPDVSFGFSYGNQKPLDKYTIGYTFSLNYKNAREFFENAEFGRYGISGSEVSEMDRREFQVGNYGTSEALLSGLAGFALKTSNSKVRLYMLHIQSGESKAGVFDFIGSDQGSDFKAIQHSLDYSQRSLSNLLLDGYHSYTEKGMKINWKIATTYSTLSDPDIRFTRYEIEDDNSLRIGTEVGFPERIWRDLDEINTSAAFNLNKNFQFLENISTLKVGGIATYKYRNYIIRNFAINPRGDYTLTGNPDELFYESNLWPMNGEISMGTTYDTPFLPNNPNKYTAESLNTAAYVSTELTLLRKLKTILGVRVENYMQYYTGTDQLRRNVLDNEIVLNDLNLFPSINLLYQVQDDQNLRLSLTKTIARPSFKELSYAEIYDPISGITFIGGFHEDVDELAGVNYWDGNLVSTRIQNYDIRWEKFGKSNQMISLSGFFKFFKDPIEIVQYTKQVGAFQPRNVGDGQSFGAEIEFRKSLGFISQFLSGIHTNVNFTLNRSSIKMSETEYQSRIDNAREGQNIDLYREMAGQSPYLVNAGISYLGGKNGFWKRFEAGLYYNVQGSTLEYVGVADRPDIYVEPFNSLNFNSSLKLSEESNLVVGLKVQNILNEDVRYIYKSYKATDQNFERRTPGITTVLSIKYLFR